MTPTCKKFKYKKRRSSKPIIQKKRQPAVADSSRSKSSDDEYTNPFGEYDAGEVLLDIPEPTPEPRRGTIDVLREQIAKQKYTPQDLSNELLALFLSSVDFNIDLAAERIKVYFLSRQEPSPLFRDRDPSSPENIKMFKKLYVLPMPDTTEDGRKIILTGLINPTVNYSQLEHAKALALVLDLLIWEKDFGFGDFVIVLDGRGFQCPQLLQNHISDDKTITSMLLDTIPGTLRSFYFLYPPCYLEKVADTRNKIWMTVVKNKEEMISHLPADILPLEYGGNLGHLEDLLVQWNEHILQNRNFFLHFECRMIRYHERRLCHEKERETGGRSWVYRMKLEADEWEYKLQYYEKMKNLQPLKHPAYGPDRLKNQAKANREKWKQEENSRKPDEEESEDEDDLFPNPPKTRIRPTQQPEEVKTELPRCFRLNIQILNS